METNEIMNNEEVIETVAEEAVNVVANAEAKTCKGLITAAGVGVGMLAGFIIYKYIAKPALSKLKEKREAATAAKKRNASSVIVDVDDEDDEDDIPESEIEE